MDAVTQGRSLLQVGKVKAQPCFAVQLTVSPARDTWHMRTLFQPTSVSEGQSRIRADIQETCQVLEERTEITGSLGQRHYQKAVSLMHT